MERQTFSSRMISLMLIVLLMASCTTPTVKPAPIPPTRTLAPPTPTPIPLTPTPTPIPPTATPVPPTPTPIPPTPTHTLVSPTATPTQLEADQDEFPLHLDLMPGKLSAHVYVHDIETPTGDIHCWTYASDGLWQLGQKEMFFTLQRAPGEAPGDYPEEPLSFFTAVYALAEQGQLVDVGDITEFADGGFLGHKGLAYIPSESLEGVDLLLPSIAAILLQAEELDTARGFGMNRVLSRLGSAYRYYPCPPWSDRSRPGVWFPSEGEESVLGKTRRWNAPGVSVLLDGDQIVLRVSARGREVVKELLQLPSDAVVALLTEMDPTVKACLVWRPGQTQPEVITTGEADASVIAGNYIAFVPQQEKDSGLLIEDGFVMMLTDASWTAIRQALEMQTEVSVPATQDGMGLSVEWIPESPSGESETPVELREIILLTDQSELDRRVDAQPLVDYVTAIEDTVQAYFSNLEAEAGQDLLLELEIEPEGAVSLKMGSSPGFSDEMLDDLYNQVLAVPPPEVREGPIKFQLYFGIWGGFDAPISGG